jgi:hypothetical protein
MANASRDFFRAAVEGAKKKREAFTSRFLA